MAISDTDVQKILGSVLSNVLDGVQKMFDHALGQFREEINEKISHLPTKDEFYGKMDWVMGELKSMREDHKLLSGLVSIHSDEIADLQKIHPSGVHAT